jgi:AraC-like DNA-binding protein
MTDTRDFASAAMMRLVAAGLARQGIAVPPPPRGATVPRPDKRAVLQAVLDAHGPLAILRIAETAPLMPPEPVVQALRAARDLPDLMHRWHRLERFSHGRHTVWAEPLPDGAFRLTHLARSGPPPAPAESLLVLGLLAVLAEMTGASAVTLCDAAGHAWREAGRFLDPGPDPTGPVILAATTARTAPPLAQGSDPVAPLRDRMAADPLRRWTLAAQTGTAPRSLQRHLARHGTAFSRLLMEARLQVAAAHLSRTGGKSLAEIAFLSGFADQPHLARIFRREVGTTPAAYRADFGR